MGRCGTEVLLAGVLAGCGPASPGLGSAGATGAGSDGTSTGVLRPDLSPEPPPPPWGQTCPAGGYAGSADPLYAECDPYLQDCPEGLKCMPWANDGGNSWNALKCSPVADEPKAVGEPCTVEGNAVSGVDDCVRGAMCWEVDPETGMGTCIALCGGSPEDPCCPDTCSVCVRYNDGVLPLCVRTCDPILQDCEHQDLCVPLWDGAFVCVLDSGGDAGALGDPCEYPNVCDPGLYCAPAEDVTACVGATGCCARFCDPADPEACTDLPGTACVPFEVQPPRGCISTAVGGCIAP